MSQRRVSQSGSNDMRRTFQERTHGSFGAYAVTHTGSGYLRIMKCKPVIAPPTKSTTDRPQEEQAQQAVIRARLGLFELDRITERTLSPDPKWMGQPLRPVANSICHRSPTLIEVPLRFRECVSLRHWNCNRAMRASNECCRWRERCWYRPRRNRH